MLKAALINGVLWTSIMFGLFYFTKKPITIEIFTLIFVVFCALGAIKYYYKPSSKE